MIRCRILKTDDALRAPAEDLIRKTYSAQYNASVSSLPEHIIAGVDQTGEVICAAGLRFSSGGFFSERYVGEPIERVLSRMAGWPVPRERVFEVSTLVSARPSASALFIRRIVAFGETSGFAWSFFTLTGRLRKLVARMGLPLVTLAAADPARIPNAAEWGSYYAFDPVVCAVANSAAPTAVQGAGHAVAA
jgi:hypothetical protein